MTEQLSIMLISAFFGFTLVLSIMVLFFDVDVKTKILSACVLGFCIYNIISLIMIL